MPLHLAHLLQTSILIDIPRRDPRLPTSRRSAAAAGEPGAGSVPLLPGILQELRDYDKSLVFGFRVIRILVFRTSGSWGHDKVSRLWFEVSA